MIRQDLIDVINNYASIFVEQVKGQSAMGFNDISIHAEQISIPILNVVFNLELKNANQVKKNHPAIDLIDDKKGIAFQVTSTSTPKKVAATLQKFINSDLYKQYSTLYIYILTEKKSKYDTGRIRNIIKGKFHFDANIHIIDHRDIMRHISFIDSIEILGQIAGLYEQLATSFISQLQFLQNRSKYSAGRPLSYIDRVRNELEDVIGPKNIDRIPELSELFSRISTLENDLQDKEKELNNFRKLGDSHKEEESLQEVLIKACIKAENEYNNIKQTIEHEKEAVSALSLNIRRQKEFLDQVDLQQASERMKEARRLFEAGEYTMVNTLVNYEGRQEYVSKKLEERERQSVELKSLANEEVLLALNMLQSHDWLMHVHQIKAHFEQSIELGGYDLNAWQYSHFLEDINRHEEAVNILYKTLVLLPETDLKNKAAIWNRLGKLLSDSQKDEALKAFTEATTIYEYLFNEDSREHEFEFAEALMQCGTLHYQQSSFQEARKYLEQALMIVGTINKKADTNMQKLTYIILMALGSLHQQLGNDDQVATFHKLGLYMGAVISLNNPENELFALLEAVRRFRILLGEEVDGPHSEKIYDYALYHFTRIQKWQSQEDALNTGRALIKLGNYLLVKQEVAGADVCFRGALKIFKTLNKKGFPCLADVSEGLKWVGFIYLTKNNVKARKKVLLEALRIRKQLAEDEPVENLRKAASLLDELYYNSFIAVPPSQYYKAYPFFDESLAIYKQLDEKYQEPDFDKWLELLQHKATFFSAGLDKTNAITWYRELIIFTNRIPASSIKFYEDDIRMAIHEAGHVLLQNIQVDDVLFLEIAKQVINARKTLFQGDSLKYKDYLLWALLEVGNNLADTKMWKEACPYLEDAVEMLQKLVKQNPDKYYKNLMSPAFKLAVGYSELKEHERSVNLLTDLCNYFESSLSQHPEYSSLLVSLMLSLTDELLSSGQKEKAANCIAKAKTYLPIINDRSQQNRLKKSFEKLTHEHFRIKG